MDEQRAVPAGTREVRVVWAEGPLQEAHLARLTMSRDNRAVRLERVHLHQISEQQRTGLLEQQQVIDARTAERDQARAELEVANAELVALRAERDELAAELAATRSRSVVRLADQAARTVEKVPGAAPVARRVARALAGRGAQPPAGPPPGPGSSTTS